MTSYPLGLQFWFGFDDINDAFSSGDINLRAFDATVASGTLRSYSHNFHRGDGARFQVGAQIVLAGVSSPCGESSTYPCFTKRASSSPALSTIAPRIELLFVEYL